jgi:hypothetical protein
VWFCEGAAIAMEARDTLKLEREWFQRLVSHDIELFTGQPTVNS